MISAFQKKMILVGIFTYLLFYQIDSNEYHLMVILSLITVIVSHIFIKENIYMKFLIIQYSSLKKKKKQEDKNKQKQKQKEKHLLPLKNQQPKKQQVMYLLHLILLLFQQNMCG